MYEEPWECLSPEKAFSGELFRPSADCSLERLVLGVAPSSADTISFLASAETTEKPILKKLIIDATQNRRKVKKTIKFATKKTIIDADAKTVRTVLTLDEALYDVRKFSISAYKGSEKEAANVDLAIKLGAKRQKRKHINYNEFKEQLKQKRTERREQKELRRKDNACNKKKLSKVKKKSKKRSKV